MLRPDIYIERERERYIKEGRNCRQNYCGDSAKSAFLASDFISRADLELFLSI